MANPTRNLAKRVILLSMALCFFSIAQAGNAQFKVDGEVYCDKCRALFKNRLSEPVEGATVRLECRDPEERHLTYSLEGQTDASGHYSLAVEGDHEEEICEVVLVKSSKADCSEIPKEGWAKATSRITLTAANGFADHVRHANPLGFLVKEPLSQCLEVYKELNILPPEQL